MEQGYRHAVPDILVIDSDETLFHISEPKSRFAESSRCSLLHFMGHQKQRGVIIQRKEGVSVVLSCAMVPQIILYGIEGRERVMTVI